MVLVKFLRQNGMDLSQVDREVKQGRLEYFRKSGKTCLRKVSLNSFTMSSQPSKIPSAKAVDTTLSSMLGWS